MSHAAVITERLSLPRLQLAWLALVLAAVGYCALHALLLDSQFQWQLTAHWAATRWGAWPVVLVLASAVYHGLAQRRRHKLGALVALAVSLLGPSVTWYALGGVSLPEAIYRATPVAAGTLAFLTLAALLMPLRHVSPEATASTLTVWRGTREMSINPQQIEVLKAAANYVEIHARGETYLRRQPLSQLVQQLGAPFVRVHRSWAVNRDHMDGFRNRSRGAYLFARSGLRVPVSRSGAKAWKSAGPIDP